MYPSFEWAYQKIERSIKQIGLAGTRVAGAEDQDNRNGIEDNHAYIHGVEELIVDS